MNVLLKNDVDNSKDLSQEFLVTLFENRHFLKVIEISSLLILKNSELPLAYSMKGLSLSALGKNKEAVEVFKDGIKTNPNNAELCNNLAIIFQEQMNYEKAIFYSKRSIELNSNSSESYFTLGVSLNCLNKLDEATKAYQLSFKKNINNHQALLQLGNSLKDQKKFSKALEVYRKHQKFFPQRVDGLYSEGCLHIRNQRFKFGWKGYEKGLTDKSRLPVNGYYKENNIKWDGKKFEGTLLVYGEQGLGDQIIFGTLISDLLKIQENIILKINKKLVNFMQFNFPNIKVVPENSFIDQNSYRKYIALGSLCKFLRNNTSDFKTSSFISFNSPRTKVEIKSIFSKDKLNIGFSWYSFAEKTGEQRSLSEDEISTFTELENINLINLQYGNIKNLYKHKLDSTNKINLTDDIDTVSNIVSACDLIITIDNTLAHLSGSLGKETWVLLPFSADWRWFENIEKSLWYTNVSLFRQHKSRDWSEVLYKVKYKLNNLIK